MEWKNLLTNEARLPYYKKLMAFIDNEYQTKAIFPKQKDIYKAFELCPFEQVKVIILGQDPYHDFGQAHGLAFSVQDGQKIPKSLQNIFKELQTDLGIHPPQSGDLSHWAKEGVFLLNTILTVEAHKPLSHKNQGWEIFTDHVIEALNIDNRPKIFVLWGNQARQKKTLITNTHHLVIESSHPSPLSARHSFFNSRVFSRINGFLKDTNQEIIDFTL